MNGNRDQRSFWTDQAGPLWVDQRAAMDTALAKILDGTLARAELQSGHSVLDIGCGAGTSTLAVAQIIGNSGHVTGIDISTTLLEAAHARLKGQHNIAFLQADAQSHPFVPQSANRIVSRFGVMFFDDPAAAFRNMATALRHDGRIVFSAWADIAENPFFTLPAKIARELLGPVPKSDPDGPGPFSLRDPARIAQIMDDAGLIADVETVAETLTIPDGAEAMARVMCQIGPANKTLGHYDADSAQHTRLMDSLTEALAPFETGKGITLPAQINYVTARKSS